MAKLSGSSEESLGVAQNKLDLAIALLLDQWDSLRVAVQNNWGGPDAADRRDWFAGAVSDLLASEPDADVEYLEEFLLGVMMDNFDVLVDDGSAADVARQILRAKDGIARGDFQLVDALHAQWKERQITGSAQIHIQHVQNIDEDDSDDDDSDEADEDNANEVDMEEAPALVPAARTKPVPRVDEDGFTEVVSKKKR